ncbi:hypothetical protein [Vreelandella massiliensis]|uniref:hypothetical protein n=1 Tax=Vreelandella massiliensis TaxID=1816686 RepID=UPI00096A8652|nr:hypothetical protein [Halomonas massiliensis]MYL25107.1 hypothetical protein [Halomonas alkaliantarctica]
MPIEFKRRSAIFTGACEVEEAETLHSWLLEQPKASLNLRHCEHLHTAMLQVILAAKLHASVKIDPPPNDPWLAQVLRQASASQLDAKMGEAWA